MRWKGLVVLSLAATIAVGTWSQPAQADASLSNTKVAAALAMPFFALPGIRAKEDDVLAEDEISLGNGLVTYMQVTNALDTGIGLGVEIIDGGNLNLYSSDPGTWDGLSASCNLTAHETALIKIEYAYGISYISTVESGVGCQLNESITAFGGMIFFYVQEGGSPVSEDAIFGDFAVLDIFGGYAVSATAVAFQGGSSNDGNLNFDFDGIEYSRFPSRLVTNFHRPDPYCSIAYPSYCRAGALVLFTLDGQPGFPPDVAIHGDWFNQFEYKRNFNYQFSCMALVDFYTLDERITTVMETKGGTMVIYPTTNGPGGPKRPFHGWIVQRDYYGGYYGRILNQGNGAFTDDGEDATLAVQGG